MFFRPLLIAILALSRTQSSADGFKCFGTDSSYVNYSVPHYVINEEGLLTLNISASSRPSHQIVSHLVRIILSEVLNYRNVSVITARDSTLPDAEQLTLTADRLGKVKASGAPAFLVDLEVWLPPGLSLHNLKGRNRSVVSAGPLGPIAQYGWFVHSNASKAFWSKEKVVIDNYRFWSLPKITNHFSNDKGSSLAKLFIPDTITHLNGSVSASEELIKKLKLKVRVPMSGKSVSKMMLEEIIKRLKTVGELSPDELVKGEEDLLLLTWFPSVVTSKYPLQRISFSSPCNLNFRNGAVNPSLTSAAPCDPFPLFQLTKWVWSGMENAAPLAHFFIRNLNIKQHEYEDMLKEVDMSVSNPTAMYERIACRWLKKNNDTWQRWLPRSMMTKVSVTLGGMFPSSDGKWTDSELITSAEQEVQNMNDNYLKEYPYRIELEKHVIQCDKQDEALWNYNQIVIGRCGKTKGSLLGILAAICSLSMAPMVELNKQYKTVIISPTIESPEFNKKKHQFFFRTVPDMHEYSNFLDRTFKEFKWKQLVLFRKDKLFVSRKTIKPTGLRLLEDFEVAEESLTIEDAKQNLEMAKKRNARIFVIEYFEKGTAKVLCAAAKLNMTPEKGYVWFLNPWLETNFLNKTGVKEAYNSSEKSDNGTVMACNTTEMLQVSRQYFVLTHLNTKEPNKAISKYSSFVKDAVKVFAYALREMSGRDTRNLSRFNNEQVAMYWRNKVQTTDYLTFNFSDNRTRPNDKYPFTLTSYNCEPVGASINCTPSVVGVWQNTTGKSNKPYTWLTGSECNETTLYKCKEIKWRTSTGKAPNDGFMETENCFWPSLATRLGTCAGAIVVVVAIALACVLFIGVLLIVALRPHYKQLKEAKRQLAPFSDILNDLAPLEMKSFQIVLNLPLGEGAFGTVRGGEAKLFGQWHAVAVKTLHERATQEEKMEFLSEARIMKAFHHANIVKLLGVRAQSKSEPYMTVMEFMLYGDMKKYLIARHVLAKEEPEHSDICPATLTSMTIDIVSGLEYLHDHGYIHRDLALRNCLVGNNHQVKLCDFGLTREVNDGRDYYRFERRGMLPVRWMAPESLHSGVFTIKSDMWSFGVVLYEIVTFGNKPYRDKRNEDVIDCMRLGNDCLIRYLNNPEERLPKLLTLMRECFHFHPHERPDSAHILSYLQTDPCCVRPCLEEAPPDPGELPAGLLGPESGDRRRGGSGGGGGGTNTDRIRFHSGARGSTSTTAGGADSVFTFDYTPGGGAAGGLLHGLNSSFPGRNQVNGAALSNSAAACPADVRNYASSTEFIPMRPTRSLSGGLADELASPTTGLLETEISIGSEVDALAACDYDTSAVTFSPFANGATPHSRASLGLGSSHGSLHSRLTHAS